MKVLVKNEYESILHCFLAHPQNLAIVDSNNPYLQKFNKTLANAQYYNLINTLEGHGVKLEFLDLNGSPSQIFTRDIGFIIEDILFIAKMTDPLRQSEIKPLLDRAQKYNLKIHLMSHNVEGGDVILHDNKLFVGGGNRTNERAVEEIIGVLSQNNLTYEVVKVLFDTTKIHLDCVFNILDKDTCVISEDVFKPKDIRKYFSKTIEVPKEEIDLLAANIINLGNNRILCGNEVFSRVLIDHGYDAIFIEFGEIIKVGGSLGCCILPMLRGQKV